MAQKRKPARINGPVEVPWQHLICAVLAYADSAPVGELAEYDAERLERAARTIIARLREEKGLQP